MKHQLRPGMVAYMFETWVKSSQNNFESWSFSIYYLCPKRKKVFREDGFTWIDGTIHPMMPSTKQRSIKSLIEKYHTDYIPFQNTFPEWGLNVTKLGEL
jgi:hypothetical protein